MSSSQLSTDQPIVSSSKSGGSKPQLIITILQTLQLALLVPFSNALPSAPPAAKKILQPIYKDAYLANLSPEVLDRVAADEWKKELGLVSGGPRAPEGKRKAVVSSNAFRKSQLLRQEGIYLGEPSCKQVVLTLSCKGKEVVHVPVDVDVKMEAPEELDAMNLDYPEEAPPPPTPVWKAQVPSNGSSPTRDKMVKTAVECVVTRMALLFASPRKKMLEQILWALVDGLMQGAFAGLKEQLQHSPSKPPPSFSSKSLL
ncbi:hypothetical protein GYMLUDRAFT_248896 [Collybiopsis luxurians FD-317 M1]|uniref:Uncharacterized protein n=1 Tax=Collybiopsis luxurians FD-317 M1 TaxID=944289 RepID=A0A0D0BK71_9AGAR|nr:hypothetical protein GYMLUDRAFT_248896 [Collybiopsis luxurians FD-317 M1]